MAGICMCYHMHYTGVDLGSNTSEDIIISLRGKTVSDLYIYFSQIDRCSMQEIFVRTKTGDILSPLEASSLP